MVFTKNFIILIISCFVFLKAQNILPGQKNAIKSLATSAGFSQQELDSYLSQNYGKTLNNLSQKEGASLISGLQDGSIKKPSKRIKSNKELNIASTLEAGMKKRFHFTDGTVKEGEILSINDGIVNLKTGSGTFKYPEEMFLSETAEITNKKGESFKGVVLGETLEEFIIRTPFGDAIVQKRDIQNMKRYHGGILDKKSDERRQFYQSEAQLIGIFRDPTAFPLLGNTFYLSGLSMGYGLTDRFMIRTEFGANFSGDLNLHPRMRFYHKKSASKEVAASWGFGLHRKYSSKNIIGKYSHAIVVTNPDGSTANFNDQENFEVADLVNPDYDRGIYAEGYLVFSSRRTNPTGRGKVGWTLGTKVSNAFVKRKDIIKNSLESSNQIYQFKWSEDSKYSIPFRTWLAIEYDLRKDLKFVASSWIDNGYKTMALDQTIDDYFGNDGSPSFSIDSPKGEASLIDFDFGILYAVNDNFRFGIHFQQPYIDIYWEFFEF
jgi:hypothetical protein